MAKKKKTTTRRTAAKGGAQRKTARKPATRRKKAAAPKKASRRAVAKPRELRLSDLRHQINRALVQIDKVADRDPAKYDKARVKFASWAADIDDMCDPENPFGCGPIMVVPT